MRRRDVRGRHLRGRHLGGTHVGGTHAGVPLLVFLLLAVWGWVRLALRAFPMPVFSPVTSSGPPVFDAASESIISTAANTSTNAHTCTGANRVLEVAVAIRQSVSGQTVSGMVDAATIAGELRAELWRLIAPATGAHNIVVTLDNTAKFVVHGCSYTGVNQTTPHGTPAKATGTSTTASVDATSAAGELVVDSVASVGTGGTLTVGADQTQRGNGVTTGGTNPSNVNGGISEQAGAASVTMSWGVAVSNEWAIVGVALKPA